MIIRILGSAAGAGNPSAIAVSEDGDAWVLVNGAHVAPETSCCAVLLTTCLNGHAASLLTHAQPRAPLPLYVTDALYAGLMRSLPAGAAAPHGGAIERHRVHADGQPFAVAPLLHTGFRAVPLAHPAPGIHIGLSITSHRSGRRVFYAAGPGTMSDPLLAAMRHADIVLADPAFCSDDMLALLARMPARRKILLGAPASARLSELGVEVASAGMDVTM